MSKIINYIIILFFVIFTAFSVTAAKLPTYNDWIKKIESDSKDYVKKTESDALIAYNESLKNKDQKEQSNLDLTTHQEKSCDCEDKSDINNNTSSNFYYDEAGNKILRISPNCKCIEQQQPPQPNLTVTKDVDNNTKNESIATPIGKNEKKNPSWNITY